MEEKYEGREIRTQSKLLAWLDNYWYHYKWHTIIIGFFLMVGIVCFVQCGTAEKYDVVVCFSGNAVFDEATEHVGLEKVLSDICPFDADQNGVKKTIFTTISVFNEDQLKSHFTYYDPALGEDYFDKEAMNQYLPRNTENAKNISSYVMTGDCAVWFVSPYVYETYFKDLITESIKLSDTALYKNFDAVKVMPEDTLVVLLRPVFGEYSKDEAYAQAEAYYRAIVGEQ